MRKLYLGLVFLLVGALSVTLIAGRHRSSQVEVTLTAQQATVEVIPGGKFSGWTFNGQIPGPVVRVNAGDTVNFTLRNADPSMPHSMDFHAAQTPWDQSFVDVQPGGSHAYTWQAHYPGVFMYHCGTSPILMHVANGMYGVVIVDPKKPMRPAREYVLVQSEFYGNGTDLQAMTVGKPTAVVFNGQKNRYMMHPLQAKPGELIRLYVVNAGPNHFSAFHVVGAVFDRVYVDGNPDNVLRGVQTYTIPPGGGAIFELTIPAEGRYPIMTHALADATLGAMGILQVSQNATSLPLMP